MVDDATTIGRMTPVDEVTGSAGVPALPLPPGPACLVVASAPLAGTIGRIFELGEWQEPVIGRGSDADLQIEDQGISRRHARVRRPRAGAYVLFDLESSNGTYLNGRRVKRAVLREGDRIQMGAATVLRFSTRRGLEEGEQRRRQALAAGGVGTWEWDVASQRLALTGDSERLIRPQGSDAWLAVHPDDRQRLRDELQSALATRATAELEARILGEGGSLTWVSLRGELLRDEAGEPLRFAGALVDVTARVRAEKETRRQALMFECMSDAVLVVDLTGAILDWNPAAQRLLGHSRAEALGRRPGELLEPGQPEPFLVAAAAGIAAEGRWKGERRLGRKGGGECDVELEAFPLRDAGARHLANVIVCRDVGEQRRLHAQILLADRLSALGTLAVGVAHEINNPLAFIHANLGCLVELLERPHGSVGGEGLREAQAMLAEMREGLDRIALIVSQLKTYSRNAEAGEGRARIDRVVSYALRIAKSELDKRARFVQDVASAPEVAMPEPQLGQVLVNLLINAAQAMGGDRARNEVRVACARDQAADAVVLTVSDNGAGIPASVLPRIFDPFFTTKPAGVGTGLGLFVCRNLVEAAGGTIAVQSRAGRGTTFTVTLPRAPLRPKEDASPTPSKAKGMPAEQATRRLVPGAQMMGSMGP